MTAAEIAEEFITGWVYCDWEGEIHEDEPDPYNKGPVYELEDEDEKNSGAWELRKDPQYGEQLLWFFTCPGPHQQLKGTAMDYDPNEIPNSDHTEKKKKKDPKLETDRVIKAIKDLAPVTLDEIVYDIYKVTDDNVRRSRVYHHVKKLNDQGTIAKVGDSQPAIYRMNDAKPSNTSSTGDLFELVGRIGEKMAVRSLDTQQIYVLEEV